MSGELSPGYETRNPFQSPLEFMARVLKRCASEVVLTDKMGFRHRRSSLRHPSS